MEWNSDLTTVNYRLADLYRSADLATGLITRALFKTNQIDITGDPIRMWFNVLDYAAKANDWNRVIALLETVVGSNELGSDDQILKSILTNFRNGQFSIASPKPTVSAANPAPAANELEKVVSTINTLLPISFLDQGAMAAKAVVRVVVPRGLASGFMIADNLLVTCNNIIPSREIARETKIQFNFQKDSSGSDMTFDEVGLDPDAFFVTSAGKPETKPFDYTIVKVQGDMNARYGSLTLSKTPAIRGDFVNIIQHPAGGPKQIAMYNNAILGVSDAVVHYLTETLPGSTGAPVFNSAWEVVALHHARGMLVDPETKMTVFRKEGIPIQRIREALL